MNIHKNARLTPKGREILVRRIVNEGLRVEEAAQAELAERFEVHRNQIQSWKKQLVESAEKPFIRGRGGASDEREREVKALHAKIGELSMEKDFLSTALGRDRLRTLCIATAAAPALIWIT